MDNKEIMQNRTIEKLLEFGILNIDKPSGPTSFGVVEIIQKLLGLRKASHFGTLDPKVTGVLPIALNRACKLTGYFISHDKEYIGIMRLHEDISIGKIQELINEKFLGKIKQIPPVKSRVKRQEREREIYEFEIIEKDKNDFLFRVKCQGGTYVRKLIDDLGKELGIGAHMLELRRTKAGIFSESDKEFINLYELGKAINNKDELKKLIIPAEESIKKKFKTIQVKETEIQRLYTGKPVFKKDVLGNLNLQEGEVIGVFANEKFIGMYKVINDNETFAKPEFVMQPMKQ